MTLSSLVKQSGFSIFSAAVIGAASVSCFYPDALPLFAGRIFAAIVFASSAILAIRFKRLNVLYVILFLAAISFLLTSGLTTGFSDGKAGVFSDSELETIRILAWFLLPINFAVFAIFDERSAFSFSSFMRFVAVVLQIFAVLWIAKSSAAWHITDALTFSLIGNGDWAFQEPQIALALSLIVIVILSALVSISAHKTIQTALLFAFISSLAALFFHPLQTVSNAFFSAAAFIVFSGFIHFAYRLAFYDELTGVLCRRALNDEIVRLEGVYTIAMIDIDHFKRFNDEYGHDTGDQALKMVASRLAATRGGAVAYRYGGEEFALVFEGKNKNEAAPFLEDARSFIEATPFMRRTARQDNKTKKSGERVKLTKSLRITISIGAADSAEGGSPSDVLQKADDGLYKAKGEGRNRLVLV